MQNLCGAIHTTDIPARIHLEMRGQAAPSWDTLFLVGRAVARLVAILSDDIICFDVHHG